MATVFWLQGDRAYRGGASEDNCPYGEDYGKQKGESLNAREEWLYGYRGQKAASAAKEEEADDTL